MSCLKILTLGAVSAVLLVQGLLDFGLVLVCRVDVRE